MNSELHVMIDLETLSTRGNAIILEVGYAIFETKGWADGVQESGAWKLNWGLQIGQRHLSQETFDWWMRQSDDAFKGAFAGDERLSPVDFIGTFSNAIPWQNVTGVWSHGAGFDIPILDDLHQQHGHRVPWHYRTPRDTRTLFWLADITSADHIKPTLAHSAESDAIAQALTVQKALRQLNWA